MQMLKAIIIGMIAVALITLFCGCKTVTKVVEVEKVRTDTTYITKHQRDSIHVHDSVYLHEYTLGDTVYIEKVRWRTDIKEKLRIDTIYKSKTDTVKVSVKVIEGTKERIQAFEGIVIAKKNGGIRETFTVRRISYGIGVERTFPVHSPKVAKIDVVKRGKVRRAKLYYLRKLTGKAAKVEEIL